ncbi:MAG: SMC-Scp complex subunit ScpB [Nanoarchaeota archaeon]|nr:SMC-Scp complex subunit ScpB [Nanoarchaeota archaeon]
MEDMQNKVEAVLFITGSFMTIEDIGKSAGIGSEGLVKEAVQKLKASYDEKQGSLEIVENEGKYKIALRKDYVLFSTKLLSNTELDRPTQETLAIIAYKQPILQADLIKVRGNGAYDHIHTLKDLQFIISEKFGRTRKLKLAPKFFDYFDIAGDMLKAKCDEIGRKVGNVERIERKKPEEKQEQASLDGYKKEEEAPSEADDDVQPDPEDIQPDKPEPHDPRKKPEDDTPEEHGNPEDPDDNPDEELADFSEDEKA